MQAAPTASTYVAPVPPFSLSPKRSIRPLISLVASGLAVGGFVLQLIGIATRNNDCNDWESNKTCREHFRMYWWTTSFQFFVALVCLLFLAIGSAKTVRIFLTACLCISTVLCILATDYFMNAADFDNFSRQHASAVDNDDYSRRHDYAADYDDYFPGYYDDCFGCNRSDHHGYYGYNRSGYGYQRSYRDGDAEPNAVIGYILSTVGNFLLIYLVGGKPAKAPTLDAGSNMGAMPLQPMPAVQTYPQSPTSLDIWRQNTRKC